MNYNNRNNNRIKINTAFKNLDKTIIKNTKKN